jgi:hypothetical protein
LTVKSIEGRDADRRFSGDSVGECRADEPEGCMT